MHLSENIELNDLNSNDIIFHGSNNDDSIKIQWNLLYECNYQCSYCGSTIPITKEFTSIDKLKKVVDQIFKIQKKIILFYDIRRRSYISSSFLELIEYINSFNNKNIYVNILTNVSKNIAYFEKYLLSSKNINTQTDISVHLEYADINHIKELIILFNKYQKVIGIKIMLEPKLKEKAFSFFNELMNFSKENKFNMTIAEILSPPDFLHFSKDYDEEYLTWIKESREKLKNLNIDYGKGNIYYSFNKNNKIIHKQIKFADAMNNNLRNFRNLYCCAGINFINIDPNGDYSGTICGARQIVGNIYENEINLVQLYKYIKCPIDVCTCNSNDIINKYKNIKDAKKYVYNYIKKNYRNSSILKEYKRNEDDNSFNKLIDNIVWWIPIKNIRNSLKNKLKNK